MKKYFFLFGIINFLLVMGFTRVEAVTNPVCPNGYDTIPMTGYTTECDNVCNGSCISGEDEQKCHEVPYTYYVTVCKGDCTCPTTGQCSSGTEQYQLTCSDGTTTSCIRCQGDCSCPTIGQCSQGTEQYSYTCNGQTSSCQRCKGGAGSATQCIPTSFSTIPNFSGTTISSTLCSNSGTFILGSTVTTSIGTRFSGSCSKTSGESMSVDTDTSRCTWQVTATNNTYKINGYATDNENKPLSGVTIQLFNKDGGSTSAVTGSNGAYNFSVSSNKTYALLAQNTELYTFSTDPIFTGSNNFAITNADIVKDFKSGPIQPGKYKISGTVKDADEKPLSGIRVILYDSANPDESCSSIITPPIKQTISSYSCVNTQIPHPSDPGNLSTINQASLYKNGVLVKTDKDKCVGGVLEVVGCSEPDSEEFTKGYIICESGICNQGVCDGRFWTGGVYPYNSMEEFWYLNQPYCGESDGGKNFYKRGLVTIYSFVPGNGSKCGNNNTDYSFDCSGEFEGSTANVDQCTYSGSKCSQTGCVVETYCKSLGSSYDGKSTEVLTETYVCPNGCSDGACIKSGSVQASVKNNFFQLNSFLANLNIFYTPTYAQTSPESGCAVYTDANGNYEFTTLYNGAYTVKPDNTTQYSFDSQTTTIMGVDKTLHFVGKNIAISHAIFGTVTNGSNKAPISDIKVWLTIDGSKINVTTDEQGQYRFNNLKTGDYIIKPDDNTAHIFTSSAITIGDTDEAVEVNFISVHVPLAYYDIYGVVRDNEEKPISGIRVDLDDGAAGKSATTDSQGKYRFEKLIEGGYFVKPENKNGYTFYSQKATIDKTDAEVNFISGVLPPGEYDIYGVVTDKNDTPLDNIQIEIDNLGNKRYTRTLGGGQYRFENLGKGGYLVKPEDKDGHVFVLKGVNIENSDVELNFKGGELPPGEFAIFGTVADKAGASIEGINMILSHNNDNFTAITDSNGQYRFGSLPVGAYIVQAENHDDYTFSSPETVYIIGADVQVNFTSADRLFTINGIVTKGNDIPLEGITVVMEHNGEKKTVATNTEGRYEFASLEAGEYNIRPENTDKFIFPFSETINLVDSDVQVNFIAITQGEEIPEEIITELLSRNGDIVEWLESLNAGDGTGATIGTSGSSLTFDPIFTPNSLITLLNEGYIPLSNSYSPIGLSLISKYSTICGNGQVEPGEICDDGEKNGQTGFCSPDCMYIGEVRLTNYQDGMSGQTGLEANIIQTPGEIGGKVVQNAVKIGNAVEKKIAQVKNGVKKLILNNTTPEMRELAVQTAKYTAIGATSILGVTAAGLQILLYQGQWMGYTVKVGDTLESLGSQFNMTERALRAKNGLGEGGKPKPGTKIYVKNRHFLEKGYLDQLKTVLNDRHLGKFSDKITNMFAKK